MSISRAQSRRRQPARKTFPQRRRTGKLTGVAASYTSRVFLLAAFLWLSCLPSAFARSSQALDSTFLISPLKTRVVGSDELPSGLFSLEFDQTRETATGSNGCDYESASGLRYWPNRDPLGEKGGINLYGFVGNNPVIRIDPNGLVDLGGTFAARTISKGDKYGNVILQGGAPLGATFSGSGDAYIEALGAVQAGQTILQTALAGE
jgi:RHS repeat-associated protein